LRHDGSTRELAREIESGANELKLVEMQVENSYFSSIDIDEREPVDLPF